MRSAASVCVSCSLFWKARILEKISSRGVSSQEIISSCMGFSYQGFTHNPTQPYHSSHRLSTYTGNKMGVLRGNLVVPPWSATCKSVVPFAISAGSVKEQLSFSGSFPSRDSEHHQFIMSLVQPHIPRLRNDVRLSPEDRCLSQHRAGVHDQDHPRGNGRLVFR